eukprot:jgi/Chlat1/3122/Chrsp21S03358
MLSGCCWSSRPRDPARICAPHMKRGGCKSYAPPQGVSTKTKFRAGSLLLTCLTQQDDQREQTPPARHEKPTTTTSSPQVPILRIISEEYRSKHQSQSHPATASARGQERDNNKSTDGAAAPSTSRSSNPEEVPRWVARAAARVAVEAVLGEDRRRTRRRAAREMRRQARVIRGSSPSLQRESSSIGAGAPASHPLLEMYIDGNGNGHDRQQRTRVIGQWEVPGERLVWELRTAREARERQAEEAGRESALSVAKVQSKGGGAEILPPDQSLVERLSEQLEQLWAASR